MKNSIDFEMITQSLRLFFQKQRRLPSVEELRILVGYRSKGAAHELIQKLIMRGIVYKDSKGKLIPTDILRGGVRLLGAVQAGFPSPAEEELIDTLSLDEFLVAKPEATYLVKVSGDSMIDAGIHPDDLVLVERGKTPKSGDIVVAEVDGEWTMKYYVKRGARVVLKPANKKYPEITPTRELTIGGIVTACVRKYAS